MKQGGSERERESSWVSFVIFTRTKKCNAPSQEEGNVNVKWKLCPPCPSSAFSHYYSRLHTAPKRIKTWKMGVCLGNGKEM